MLFILLARRSIRGQDESLTFQARPITTIHLTTTIQPRRCPIPGSSSGIRSWVPDLNRESPDVRAYEFLDLPLTRCVHFVVTREFDGSQEQVVEAAIRKDVKCVYWDYLDGGSTSATIADPLGRALELAHAPYGRLPWIEFLDDLITLSVRYPGLVIVVDHADILL